MKKRILLLSSIFLISSLFGQVAFCVTQSYDFLGTYLPYSQFSDKTKKYERVNPADKAPTLILNSQSTQLGDSSCNNVNYSIISKEATVNMQILNETINDIAKANNIALSKIELVKTKGNQCGLMLIIINNNYLLLLSHDKLPVLYIKK